jgi:hypothetical protein
VDGSYHRRSGSRHAKAEHFLMPNSASRPTVRRRTPADGPLILRGPVRCRFGRQIVQPARMPNERFPRRVFLRKFFRNSGHLMFRNARHSVLLSASQAVSPHICAAENLILPQEKIPQNALPSVCGKTAARSQCSRHA